MLIVPLGRPAPCPKKLSPTLMHLSVTPVTEKKEKDTVTGFASTIETKTRMATRGSAEREKNKENRIRKDKSSKAAIVVGVAKSPVKSLTTEL